MNKIDWPSTVAEIVACGHTYQQIADQCGFASKSAVHELGSGASATCSYERGCALLAMHRRVTKERVRAEAKRSAVLGKLAQVRR